MEWGRAEQVQLASTLAAGRAEGEATCQRRGSEVIGSISTLPFFRENNLDERRRASVYY
jgi:hypothetical protein